MDSIHPAELEINPPKTACGCSCGAVPAVLSHYGMHLLMCSCIDQVVLSDELGSSTVTRCSSSLLLLSAPPPPPPLQWGTPGKQKLRPALLRIQSCQRVSIFSLKYVRLLLVLLYQCMLCRKLKTLFFSFLPSWFIQFQLSLLPPPPPASPPFFASQVLYGPNYESDLAPVISVNIVFNHIAFRHLPSIAFRHLPP